MKTAALFLMMSSTAFAAPQLARKIVPGRAAPQAVRLEQPQAVPQKAPQLAPQTTLQTAPQKAPQTTRTVLRKRKAAKQALATNAEPGIKAPKIGDFELKFQLRNTMKMARAEELQNIGGENFGLSTEVRLGLKHVSGWSLTATGSHQTNNYADPSRNTGTNGDATLMLGTPSFYKNSLVNWYGVLRGYLPTSEKSRANNVRSMAYYNYLDFDLGHRLTATHVFLGRFFDRDTKGDTDVTSVIYNALEFYHQTTKGISLSFGGQFEADNTYRGGTGTEFDVYPFIDFSFIPNVLIEAKYYFPVFVGGNGSVGATGAALNQSQAELFVKIGI
jgi:hypothetical protein